jgi:hypothetical protein
MHELHARLGERQLVLLLVAVAQRLKFWEQAHTRAARSRDATLQDATGSYVSEYRSLLEALIHEGTQCTANTSRIAGRRIAAVTTTRDDFGLRSQTRVATIVRGLRVLRQRR